MDDKWPCVFFVKCYLRIVIFSKIFTNINEKNILHKNILNTFPVEKFDFITQKYHNIVLYCSAVVQWNVV